MCVQDGMLSAGASRIVETGLPACWLCSRYFGSSQWLTPSLVISVEDASTVLQHLEHRCPSSDMAWAVGGGEQCSVLSLAHVNLDHHLQGDASFRKPLP
jgi:hypothetical protein